MQCGQYEKLFKDRTLLQPDEYIFLYANNDSIMQRNKTRGKELSKSWIDTSFTDYQNEFYETVSKTSVRFCAGSCRWTYRLLLFTNKSFSVYAVYH